MTLPFQFQPYRFETVYPRFLPVIRKAAVERLCALR
jgi:hypothetical protein